ncbi:hypothetical protein E4U43_006799 [Claviceps pusilla]|uniref:Uncharacterized protein n=1 Tax=Claviceps pusilla TaxID=123648 RepID=A0A9P7T111_9HYPO|nr:hypothetical protein E4U43_006799 [Claviceps pusilla]
MPLMSRSRVKTGLRAALSVNTSVCKSDFFKDSQEYGNASRDGDDVSDDDDDEEEPVVVTSPTGLRYNLEQLSDPKRAAVRDAFKELAKILLHQCRPVEDTHYVFEMIELNTRSVRIYAPSSHAGGEGGCDEDGETHRVVGSPQISCSCSRQEDEIPATIGSQSSTWGFAEEMGDPFQAIADFHLDILADDLHCHVVDPTSFSEGEPDYDGFTKVKELLASVYSKLPQDFCPRINSHLPMGEDILMETDLLLFLARSADPVTALCRSLSRRADLVLCELDASLCPTYQPSPTSPSSVDSPKSTNIDHPETYPNVAWATTHFLRIVDQIRFSIKTRNRPWKPSECHSAVQTLVHILTSVVAPTNCCGLTTGRASLYSNLIGDRTDANFVIKELDLLPEAASYFVDRLTGIAERIATLGAPDAYMKKFKRSAAQTEVLIRRCWYEASYFERGRGLETI